MMIKNALEIHMNIVHLQMVEQLVIRTKTTKHVVEVRVQTQKEHQSVLAAHLIMIALLKDTPVVQLLNNVKVKKNSAHVRKVLNVSMIKNVVRVNANLRNYNAQDVLQVILLHVQQMNNAVNLILKITVPNPVITEKVVVVILLIAVMDNAKLFHANALNQNLVSLHIFSQPNLIEYLTRKANVAQLNFPSTKETYWILIALQHNSV